MASQALLTSNKDLVDQQGTQTDLGGAFREGQKIVEDQIAKDLKKKTEAEDREFEVTKMKQEEELRTIGLDQSIMAWNEEMGVFQTEVNQLVESGKLPGIDYPAGQKERTEWLKDGANRMKVIAAAGGDLTDITNELNTVVDAEQNWTKLQEFSLGRSVSDNNPEQQKMSMALQGYKGKTPPPVIKKGNKSYFKVPLDNGEIVEIPVDAIASGDYESLYGGADTKADFSTTMADWQASNGDSYKRLSNGVGTSNDINQIGRWYQQQIKDNPIKGKEILDSFFIQSGITLGSEQAQKLGLEDENGDGKLTSADISDQEMAEVFKGAIAAQFSDKQVGDKILDQEKKKKLGIPEGGKGSKRTFDPSASRRLDNAFASGKFDGQAMVGMTVDGKRVTAVVFSEDHNSWVAQIGVGSKGKESVLLGENPSRESILDSFAYPQEVNADGSGPAGDGIDFDSDLEALLGGEGETTTTDEDPFKDQRESRAAGQDLDKIQEAVDVLTSDKDSNTKNNADATIEKYVDKLKSQGIEVDPERIHEKGYLESLKPGVDTAPLEKFEDFESDIGGDKSFWETFTKGRGGLLNTAKAFNNAEAPGGRQTRQPKIEKMLKKVESYGLEVDHDKAYNKKTKRWNIPYLKELEKKADTILKSKK